ncbi:Histone-lysine N-methyltransferase SUV39H2, partial [Camelus dromedarius]
RGVDGNRAGGGVDIEVRVYFISKEFYFLIVAWCVPCLVSLDTLQELSRKEKLTCKSIGITKRNLNNYEVEYLCDYKVVKVITSEEAERRGQLYDNKGITYLFDLDYESDEFTVDAARYGNVSHFVNHSVRYF